MAVDPEYESQVAFDAERVGAAAIYCSDGRWGIQMDEFLQEGLGLPRYDRLAVPGGAACLAGHVLAYEERAALERQLAFLIKEHGLRRIVLIAHEGCAYYKDVWIGGLTLAQAQEADLKRAADHIRARSVGVTTEAYFARVVEGRVVFQRWLQPPPRPY
jgi:hypothetical protein